MSPTCNIGFIIRHGHRFLHGEERRNAMVSTLPEFWLVSSFCEMGNLTKFLRKSVLSWDELGSLASSFVEGLAFLHRDDPFVKPAIAHRDLKSANILLKSPGLHCVLADFGLAVQLSNLRNRKVMEESGQVSHSIHSFISAQHPVHTQPLTRYGHSGH